MHPPAKYVDDIYISVTQLHGRGVESMADAWMSDRRVERFIQDVNSSFHT